MNILITGCNGFLGRELAPLFKNDGHNVIATNRNILNVLNSEQVDEFFEKNRIDIVIHAAVKGGRKNQPDTHVNMFKNIIMLENLKKNSGKFGLMFHFGSGAEFDRTQEISNMKEEQINERNPKDFYGLSKNMIAKQINKAESNIVNLRLFGCFGPSEDNDRLIKGSILKIINGTPIEIHQDREMDFFYVKDLYKVVTHYIDNQDKKLPKDLNLCYSRKRSLTDIAHIINRVCNNEVDIILHELEKGPSYTGCGKKLEELNLDLIGLKRGIKEVYDSLLEEENVT